jgi:hypothetical protein
MNVNDGLSAICQKRPDTGQLLPDAQGRWKCPSGEVDAGATRPLLEVATRHRAVLFIHNGPRPGDAYPKVASNTDNARRRNGTLDMQASLSLVIMTLSLTDYLAD